MLSSLIKKHETKRSLGLLHNRVVVVVVSLLPYIM